MFADLMLASSRDAGDMYGGSGEFGSAAAATVLAMTLWLLLVEDGNGEDAELFDVVVGCGWRLFMYASKEPGAGGAC